MRPTGAQPSAGDQRSITCEILQCSILAISFFLQQPTEITQESEEIDFIALLFFPAQNDDFC